MSDDLWKWLVSIAVLLAGLSMVVSARKRRSKSPTFVFGCFILVLGLGLLAYRILVHGLGQAWSPN